MNIAVYCSSCANLPEEIEEGAKALGRFIGETCSTLVYGGVKAGLMTLTANACATAGGKIVGVVPEVFRSRADECVTDLMLVRDLNERKRKMIELADVFVVMPGGLGTIDEWISTISYQLVERVGGRTDNRKVLVYNHEGMYDPLIETLSRIPESPFGRGKDIPMPLSFLTMNDLIRNGLAKLNNPDNGRH